MSKTKRHIIIIRKTMKMIKLLYLLFLIAAFSLVFYFKIYHPMEARKQCQEETYQRYKGKRMTINLLRAYNLHYYKCLHSKGVEK